MNVKDIISNNIPEVKISSYGRYSSDNYGLNTLMLTLGSFRVYYSYDTIVAFYDSELGLVVANNVWSTTTGKHLNWIDNGNKKNRVNYELFTELLNKVICKHVK